MKKEMKGMKMVEYKGNLSGGSKMPMPKKAVKGKAMKGGKKRKSSRKSAYASNPCGCGR